MIYRISKPNSGYIIFTETQEPLHTIQASYPGYLVTLSSQTELDAFQALSHKSYQDLTANPQKRRRPRKPVFSTKKHITK